MNVEYTSRNSFQRYHQQRPLRRQAGVLGRCVAGSTLFLCAWVLGACTSADSAEHEARRPTASVRSAVLGQENYVTSTPQAGSFALAEEGQPVPILVSSDDFPGVARVAEHFRDDIELVTGERPELLLDDPEDHARLVVVGTIGQNPWIDELVADGKLDVSDVEGRWETFVIEAIDEPYAGVEQALVIAGSDKRATLFGMFDLSAAMGVSPWVYWADVPAPSRDDLYVAPGRHSAGTPAVKYRGIFLNDEDPALSGWVRSTFGGFGHEFYEQVFELMLRMKANYLWPAQWGKAFSDDDEENPRLANEYGIVIGTSHHEPMMRTQEEWSRYGSGPWNYRENQAELDAFWRAGVERMGSHESLVTVGMRGDGDEPLLDAVDIPLLEEIIANQRAILEDVTGENAEDIPQIWAIYKEVLEYYDAGIEIPDDVIQVFSDDNWGNIERLPELDAEPRSGGYGVYYHYDYVGGPRSYKWINTNLVPRVWEQMQLAYHHGVDQLWLVNVGDLKPMEYPTQFFLDLAWNPDAWPVERLPEYGELWAAQQFGSEYAEDIAEILGTYTKYNARRKPELLFPGTYSLENYHEADRIVADYNRLSNRAEELFADLPDESRDAFYQLVLYPVKASANLNEYYVTLARQMIYARQGRAAANRLVDRVRELFARDGDLARYYNEEMAGGKWTHMMDQAKIGATDWRAPTADTLPALSKIELPEAAELGVALEGSDNDWPGSNQDARLPELSPFQRDPGRYLEIFNRGQTPFEFEIDGDEPWLEVTPSSGEVDEQQRVRISADWERVPEGASTVSLRVRGAGDEVIVEVPVHNSLSEVPENFDGFVAADNHIAIEADEFTNAVDGDELSWQRLPNLGRTGSAMTVLPVTTPSEETPGGDTPHLEYRVHVFTSDARIRAYFSPTNNFRAQKLRYAVSFDDQPPEVVEVSPVETTPAWEERVRDNIAVQTTSHEFESPGEHTVKFWFVDTGVLLQKLVVITGGTRPSYLGPPTARYDEPEPVELMPFALDLARSRSSDAGAEDAGADPRTQSSAGEDGCACGLFASGPRHTSHWWLYALAGIAVVRRFHGRPRTARTPG